MYTTAHIKPHELFQKCRNFPSHMTEKKAVIECPLKYVNVPNPLTCLFDENYGLLNKPDKDYMSFFDELKFLDVFPEKKLSEELLEKINSMTLIKSQDDNFYKHSAHVSNMLDLIETSNSKNNIISSLNTPDSLLQFTNIQSPVPLSPNIRKKKSAVYGETTRKEINDDTEENKYYINYPLIQHDLLNDTNDLTLCLKNLQAENYLLTGESAPNVGENIISVQNLLDRNGWSAHKKTDSPVLLQSSSKKGVEENLLPSSPPRPPPSLSSGCSSSAEAMYKIEDHAVSNDNANSNSINFNVGTTVDATTATNAGTVGGGYYTYDTPPPVSNTTPIKKKYKKKEIHISPPYVEYNTPMVLVHPEEFRNPSSFLKVYGDPLCGKISTMASGQNGNWSCICCGNINYPRRFRCNKCNETRDKKGDDIVNSYVQLVYEQHIRAYRKRYNKTYNRLNNAYKNKQQFFQ